MIFLKVAWAREDSAPTPPAAPPPGNQLLSSDNSQDQEEKELERFRAAVKVLDSSKETKEILGAMEILREGFPKSRPVLTECVEKDSPAAKCFAIQLLGEKGEATKDLEVVVKALRDPKSNVRLAAVMAIRHLGKDGFPALQEYLFRETEANNRKMAIKTLQHWGEKAAIPLLVRLLKKEGEKTVRNFLVTALEALSGKHFGDNPEAWESYVVDTAIQEQAKVLLLPQKDKNEATKP